MLYLVQQPRYMKGGLLPKGLLTQLEKDVLRGDISMAVTSLIDCPRRQPIFKMASGDMSC